VLINSVSFVVGVHLVVVVVVVILLCAVAGPGYCSDR